MSEQPLYIALHQVCAEIRDAEIENLKLISLKDRQIITLNQRQVFELSERIQSLPQICRDVLLARYCYRMDAEEIEDLYSINDARGKCLYAEKLLGYALNLNDDEAISPESLAAACKLADEYISDEIKREAETHPTSAASRKHNRRMKDILRRDGKQSKLFLTMRYAAMFALVLLLSGAITLSVNAELRAKFFNWLVKNYEEYSSFSLGSGATANSYSEMDIEKIHLEYIPDGFELTEEYASPRFFNMKYQNQNEIQISVLVTMPDGTTQNLNTEDVIIEDTFVNGNKAHYWTKNDTNFIVWEQEGHLFSLITELDRETAMKIAENIRVEIKDNMDVRPFYLGYIPDGFELTDEALTSDIRVQQYYNQDNIQIYIMATPPNGESHRLDTEGATIENIYINGTDALFWNKAETCFIVWERNGYMLSLITEHDRKTAIKIAENIQIEAAGSFETAIVPDTEKVIYRENDLPNNWPEHQAFVDKYMNPFATSMLFGADFSPDDMSAFDRMPPSLFGYIYFNDNPDNDLGISDEESEVPGDMLEGMMMAHLPLSTQQIRKTFAQYYDADRHMYTATFGGLGGDPVKFIITYSNEKGTERNFVYDVYVPDYDRNIAGAGDDYYWVLCQRGRLQMEIDGDSYKYVSNTLRDVPGFD